MNTKPLSLSLLAFLVLLAIPGRASPLGSAFTYQGRLTDGSSPAHGIYDLTFSLYDTAVAGSLTGDPPTNLAPAVVVSSGLFTITLDFGPTAFAGSARWLQMAVRTNGSPASYTVLSPRQPLTPAPHALYAPSAGTAASATTATTANGVAANAITGAGIQNSTLTASKFASGAVVKSLNMLKDDVSLVAGTNVSILPSGNSLQISASGWGLTGNRDTSGENFLGTLDNRALELKVNNERVLRLEPKISSPNLIGGMRYNVVTAGAIGATIAGGGSYDFSSFPGGVLLPNLVTDDFGTVGGGESNTAGNRSGTTDDATYATVGGGQNNTASGYYATVPGGADNTAAGEYSFAAGQGAMASHDGSFVWSDASSFSEPFRSTARNQFIIRAAGGVGIGTSFPTQALDVRDGNGANGDGGSIHVGGLGANGDPKLIIFGDRDFFAGEDYMHIGENGVDDTLELKAARFVFLGGEVKLSVLTITGGADLAEPFKMSARDIPAGAVVVIDEKNPGGLTMSERAYDHRVAGIVSGANGIKPGITLHQEGALEGGQNVSLSGRVYVLADATRGAIAPGDLLTTSDTPGHAMKVTDSTRAQGAILGKAMGSLDDGRGMVLVLVSLQ